MLHGQEFAEKIRKRPMVQNPAGSSESEVLAGSA